MEFYLNSCRNSLYHYCGIFKCADVATESDKGSRFKVGLPAIPWENRFTLCRHFSHLATLRAPGNNPSPQPKEKYCMGNTYLFLELTFPTEARKYVLLVMVGFFFFGLQRKCSAMLGIKQHIFMTKRLHI